MNKAVFFLILILIFLCCSRQSSGPGNDAFQLNTDKDLREIEAGLEKGIPTLMNEFAIPGLSIGLVRNDEVAWLGAFGVTNTETKQRINDDTVFEAASLSKPVFAYLILKLIGRGILSLDIPLAEYAAPDILKKKFWGPDFNDLRGQKITARLVLNHSTGLPNWRDDDTIKFGSDPGRKFSYSAEAFFYLQVVVENMTGRKLPELMQTEVFGPLGMTQSSYIWQPGFEGNSAYRHDVMGEVRGLRRHTKALGPASLQTTARDYALFLKALMSGEGLKEVNHREMLRAQSTYGREGYEGVDWGLGTGLERSEHGTGIWHWGDNAYAQAFYLTSPDRKTGFVYFANGPCGLAIAGEIAQIAMGGRHPVMSCGIMRPYLAVGKSIPPLIFELKNGALEKAKDIVQKNILPYIGQQSIYNETLLNDIGSWFLNEGSILEAIEIFKLNMEAYPGSWIVYDSIAEAYEKSGNVDLAVKNCIKSLELNPDNENGKQMIERLKAAPKKRKP